ncbi:hypothetical protein [Methylobacterium sp. SyP6R]|uniref:hypothetical protein n=1 Tax=Methylobacterium sp. SyP6R TaxID=2718876 RepID=UPI001F322140|nr:hypothetical protein [Methylobacterium sp. SyP6R]MCF4129922.1 hypothetical protein [Methylobacterium sp. SyP6R]
MSDTETQRMILQRVDPGAAPSETAAGKVEADPQVALIERASPSSMLVEGAPAAIDHLVGTLDGWSAFPMTTYDRPTTRPRILRRPDEA